MYSLKRINNLNHIFSHKDDPIAFCGIGFWGYMEKPYNKKLRVCKTCKASLLRIHRESGKMIKRLKEYK